MTMAFETTPFFQKIAPATIHPADLTTRPQILKRGHNKKYFRAPDDFFSTTYSR